MFRVRHRVRFSDEDHAQMVYFPRIFHFFHIAFEDFFASEGKPYRDVLAGEMIGWPAVAAEAEFIAPMHFGDDVDIDLWVEKVGTKSARFRYRITRARDQARTASGIVTVVCMNLRTRASMPIPDEYRAIFTRHPYGGE